MLTVLPVTGSYFTKIVKGLFRMMRYSLLGFDFIEFWSLFKINMNYSQDNETLEYIGFESGSSIINLVGFIIVGALIIVIDTLVYKMIKMLISAWTKYVWSVPICRNIKNWIWISFYIRYLLLGYWHHNTKKIYVQKIKNFSFKKLSKIVLSFLQLSAFLDWLFLC